MDWFQATHGANGKTQAVTKASILSGILVSAILPMGGCATGPKYDDGGRADSAGLEGPVAPTQTPEDGSCTVVLMRIDGMAANFTVSHLGLNWPMFEGLKPIAIAPGKHSLLLNITDIDEVYGNIGHGTIGETGAYTTASNPTIGVNLAASHIYRIGANLKSNVITVTLWDETGGIAGRPIVATWAVKGDGVYMEATPPSGGRH